MFESCTNIDKEKDMNKGWRINDNYLRNRQLNEGEEYIDMNDVRIFKGEFN